MARHIRDHPRSRGVYFRVGGATAAYDGSSPLARGLLAEYYDYPWDYRIIPARAGFTVRPLAPQPRHRDHPRSRGVYGGAGRFPALTHGSSSLARGLLYAAFMAVLVRRIIPARAGFTARPRAARVRRGDHPRSRGVYMRCGPGTWPGRGSSPLARGLHPAAEPPGALDRIIPARAGFTDAGPEWNPAPSGSSPLARGLRSPTR